MPMKTGLPAISGALNNCSIGAALPSILTKIETLAALENNALFHEQVNLAEYKKIKQHFCDYYQQNNENFTFKRLADFLNKQSFYSQQLIMGPPIRGYIFDKAVESLEYMAADCKFKTIMNDENDEEVLGRYPGLTPKETNNFLYQPLGIEARFFVKPDEPTEFISKEEANSQGFIQSDTLEFKINVHLKDGHYELQPHDQVVRLDLSNENFVNVATQLGEGSSEQSTAALQTLKGSVENDLELFVSHQSAMSPEQRIEEKISKLVEPIDNDFKAAYKEMITTLIKNHETLLQANASDSESEKLAKELQQQGIDGFKNSP